MTTAPPSPPVAPEPAQENQAKRAEFEALAEKVGAPDVTVLASSGEPAQENREPTGDALGEMSGVKDDFTGETLYVPRCKHTSVSTGTRCTKPDGHVGLHRVLRPETFLEEEASSGEAAGDGVTVDFPELRYCEAHEWASMISKGDPDPCCPECGGWSAGATLVEQHRKQEQAEREARGLIQALAGSAGLHLDEPNAENLQAGIEHVIRVRDEWQTQATEKIKSLLSDRDAERAQKEALLKELEQWKSIAAERERNTLRISAVVESLCTERDELKVRLDAANAICRVRLAALNHANDGRVLLRCHDCDELTFVNHDCLAAQQPAPAAPVAKEDDASLQHFGSGVGGSERPDIVARRMRKGAMPPQSQGGAEAVRDVRSTGGDVPGVCGDGQPGAANEAPGAAGPVPGVAPVAKEEATAEAWVPKVGDAVTSWRTPRFGRGVIVAIPSQTLANSVDNCDVEFEDGRVREIWLSSLAQAPLEPAPQPPATEWKWCPDCEGTEKHGDDRRCTNAWHRLVEPPATTGEGGTVGPCSIEVDALRAEIVAALKAGNDAACRHPNWGPVAAAFEVMVAKLEEMVKP